MAFFAGAFSSGCLAHLSVKHWSFIGLLLANNSDRNHRGKQSEGRKERKQD